MLPVLLAAASSPWFAMPDGKYYHQSCIVHHEDFHFNIDTTQNDPCKFKPRNAASLANYYSDWSVYAQTATTSTFTSMTSTWKVPPKPLKHGPFELSSVYLFNGLEDGGGVHGKASIILQPVLQYGKSGCLINPVDWSTWHAGSYLVDGNGRAHCGKSFPVVENDTIVGTMIENGNNTWTVSTSGGKNNVTSSYTASLGDKQLNAAYLTLEGMVIYNCQTYPTNNGVEFSKIHLETKEGSVKSPQWKSELRHTECDQSVNVIDGNNVELKWNSNK